MTYRRIRRLGGIIAIFAMALLVVVAQASAATNASAVRKATKIQNNDCKWGFPLLYKCNNPAFVGVACVPTGVDIPGQPQHICGGVFVRQQRLSGAVQFCYSKYSLSPWNAELHGSGYKCYGSLVSSKDHAVNFMLGKRLGRGRYIGRCTRTHHLAILHSGKGTYCLWHRIRRGIHA